MLKKHAHFFETLFFISDLLIISTAWILSYFLRFHTTFIRAPLLGTPPLSLYVEFLLPLWVIWVLLVKKTGLYRARRFGHFYKEILEVGKVLSATLLILIAVIYCFRSFEFSRLALLYFWLVSFLGFLSMHFLARKVLRTLRRRGYNQRFVLIAGTGELGRKILEEIKLYPELGIRVVGFLSGKEEEVGKKIENIPVLGIYEDLDEVLRTRGIDIFFIAISVNEYGYFESLIKKVEGHLSEIKVIPASYEFLSLRGGMDELGDLPIVNLQSSPLYGWDRVYKRIFDLFLGALILTVVSPVMVVISLLVKLSSEGTILYKQERVGMDGHPFQMLKFRTMREDAERETGPVWAKENDPRRTKIGDILRKSSLDELPQLFNVLRGEMSLVGPRPERPNFVEEFRYKIPSYMLRHKIKAGMTGWAQVNGWRGNTSLEKRIEHDLHYIQNWSVGFDLRILFMTLRKGFFNKSAY